MRKLNQIINFIPVLFCLVGLVCQHHLTAQTIFESENIDSVIVNLSSEAHRAYFDKKYQSSIRKWNQLLDYYRQQNEISEMAKIQSNIARIYTRVGDFSKSIAVLDSALQIYSILKSPEDLINTYNNIARIQMSIGNYYSALSCLNSALALADSMKTISSQLEITATIGQIYYQIGDYYASDKKYREALQFAYQSNDQWWEARLNSYLGILNYYFSKLDSSLKFFETATKIQEKLEDHKSLKDNYLNQGIVNYSLNNLRTAYSFFRKSLELQKEVGDVQGEINTELRLGDSEYQEYGFNNADAWYNSAYKKAKENGFRDLQAETLKKIGYLHFSQNQNSRADQTLKDALQIAHNIDDPVLIWRIYHGLGLIAEKLGRYGDAFNHFQQAIGYVQETEPQKTNLVQTTEFTKTEVDVFIDALRMGRILCQRRPSPELFAKLFEISEALNARELYLRLKSLAIETSDSTLSDMIASVYAHSRQRTSMQRMLIDEKSKELLEQNISRVISLRNYIKYLDKQKEKLLNELVLQYPSYGYLFLTARPTLNILQSMMLPKQKLLKYIVLEDGVVILVISKRNVEYYARTIKKQELEEAIHLFFQEMHTVSEKAGDDPEFNPGRISPELQQSIERLSEALLPPSDSLFVNCDEMAILPDPVLSGFPFEALQVNLKNKKHNYWGELIPIYYLNHTELRRGLSLPTIPLKFAEVCSEQAKEIWSFTQQNDKIKSFSEFKHLIPQNPQSIFTFLKKQEGVIHFDLHGNWQKNYSESSFEMSNQKLLKLPNWFRMSPGANSLLVLPNFSFSSEPEYYDKNVCVEALKVLGPGYRIFSNWQIPKSVQYRFFEKYYEYILEESTVEVSLWEAKKDFIAQNRLRHPYFWSTFLLYH